MCDGGECVLGGWVPGMWGWARACWGQAAQGVSRCMSVSKMGGTSWFGSWACACESQAIGYTEVVGTGWQAGLVS